MSSPQEIGGEEHNTFQPIKVLSLPLKKLRIGRAEREILHDITIEFLSLDEIKQRRKCSNEAIYKVIRRLKKKGLISSPLQSVVQSLPTQPLHNTLTDFPIRLHAQEFNIQILQKSPKYAQALKNSNTITIDGNTIRLYRNSIEIYSGQSFIGKDEQEATASSFAYWNRFFNRLQNDYDIRLIKSRTQNINLVNQHYAEVNSDMAKNCLEKNIKIKVVTLDDGKVWFTIDNSWNLKERECIHPETAKQDSQLVSKHLNDWRENNPRTNSEIDNSLNQLTNAITSLPVVLNKLEEQIQSHLNLIQEYRKENIAWRKEKEREIKLLKEQTKLTGFGL